MEKPVILTLSYIRIRAEKALQRYTGVNVLKLRFLSVTLGFFVTLQIGIIREIGGCEGRGGSV